MILRNISFIIAALFLFISCTSSGTGLREENSAAREVFEPEDLVLWVFGDIQPRSENKNDRLCLEIAVNDIAKMKNIDGAICVGDIVQHGSQDLAEEAYTWFYNLYSKTGLSRKDLYEIAGNHDARNIDAYLKATGKPLHYSLQYGNLLIILLSDEKDSSGSDISDGAFNWWKNLVETNRDKNIITITHSHLGGSGFVYNIISYRNVQGSERFREVLKKEKVELWLCGHTHVPSFLGLSKRQISSLGDTVFMNTASIREDFPFSDAESRIITLKKGSDQMTVQIRNHRQAEFKGILEQVIKLKSKFEYDGKGPIKTDYHEDAAAKTIPEK